MNLDEDKKPWFRRFPTGNPWLKTVTGLLLLALVIAVICYGISRWRSHTTAPNTPPSQTVANPGNNAGNTNDNNSETSNPTPAVVPVDTFMLLRWGDTMSQLGITILDTANYRLWYQFNPGLPQDPRKLQAGKWLLVPARYADNIPSDRVTVSRSFVEGPSGSTTTASATDASTAMTDPPPSRRALHLPSSATAAIALTTNHVELDDQLSDPPLQIVTLPAYPVVLAAATVIPVAHNNIPLSESPVLASYQKPDRRSVKVSGYMMPVPPDMGLVPANKPLETLLVTRNDDGTLSQTWLKDSWVRIRKKKYVLYVPLRQLPNRPYGLFIGGINTPISGAEFTTNAQPVHGRFPGSHAFLRVVLTGGGAIGIGARVFLFGGGPIAAAATTGGILITNLVIRKHQVKIQNDLKAAEGQLVAARIETASADNGKITNHQGRAP